MYIIFHFIQNAFLNKIYRLDQGPKAPQDDRNFIELPQNP